MTLDETIWAAAHYRVERESHGSKISQRKRKRVEAAAVSHGDPVPEEAQDVVRIYDRSGEVAFQRDWGGQREAAIAQEARIVDDLLTLDLRAFRSRYGIEDPDAIATAAGLDPWREAGPVSAPDPWPREPGSDQGAAGAP